MAEDEDTVSSLSEELSEDDKDLDLSDPVVVTKYKMAGAVVNEVLAAVIGLCQPGASVLDICTRGDQLMTEALEKVYRKKKSVRKGIAFPTCLSIGNCCGHYSPLAGDETLLKEGDVVKIDLGVHVDGFVSNAAHTVIATSSEEPVEGPVADVVCAAWYAGEAALRLLRPGFKNTKVTETINGIAEAFGVKTMQGVVSHQLFRNRIDEGKSIMSRCDNPEDDVPEITFEENEVYCIDIIMTTGEGTARELDPKPTVFKRTGLEYMLKTGSARKLFSEIKRDHPYLPFSLRPYQDSHGSRAGLGVKMMLEHELLDPYPVLYEKEGVTVAQFKFTVLILPSSIDKINGDASPPYVKSEKEVTDPAIQQILEMGIKRKSKARKNKKKKRRNKKKKPAAAAEGQCL